MKNNYFILIAILILSCSKELRQSDNLKIWNEKKYIPNDIIEITGKYERHDGFVGEILILKADSTFKYGYMTDVIDDKNRLKSFSGHFELIKDTLIFHFDRFEKYELFSDSIINYTPSYAKQQITLNNFNSAFTPSLLKIIEGDVYIVYHWQLNRLLNNEMKNEGFRIIDNKKIHKNILVKIK